MNNQKQELIEIIESAIQIFERRDQYLIDKDLSERCICAKFAFCLTDALKETQYSDYCVDVEYNRSMDGNERSPKRIFDELITVDLIVHKRGYDNHYGFDNLICIEMKKSTNRDGCSSDEERLSKMTNTDYGFDYQLGVMLLINMKTNHFEIHSKWQNGHAF